MYYNSTSKYGNTKTTVDGITFDSKKEASRYQQLRLLEKAGKISNLQRQVKYILVPGYYEKNEKTNRTRCVEREVSYVADFVYVDCETGEKVVEDTKGYRTPDYKIKRKLMLWEYGIKIHET